MGAHNCSYDIYMLTRALAELALGSADPVRIIGLRDVVARHNGLRAHFERLAIADAEAHVTMRAKVHICRECRHCAAHWREEAA